MQTIKNDNERKPRTIGETMESFTNTKKRVTKSILSYTGTFISLLLIFIAIAVLTTEVNLTSAVEVVELGLTLFILIFCAYSMYVNLANSGEKAAKSGKTYIDTETKYDSTKKIIKDEKMQSRGSEFCNYWSREELKNTRCQFLDEVGIDFDVYMKSYVGKTKEELEQIKELSNAQIDAIVAANNIKAIKLTTDMFFKRGRGASGRKPLGIKPKTKKTISYIVKLITTILTMSITGVIALELIVNPTWATFAEVCLKILPIILNGIMGYKMGYENIAVDTVNYMLDQIDLMEEFIQYVRLNPVPQVFEDEENKTPESEKKNEEEVKEAVVEEEKPQVKKGKRLAEVAKKVKQKS